MRLKRCVHYDSDDAMDVSPAAKRRLCSRERDADAQAVLVCDVCLEVASAGDAVRLGACSHTMCSSCATAWCTSTVARCLQQGVPLRCALPQCRRTVPLQQAQQLLERAGVIGNEVGAAFEAAAFIPKEARFFCPYPDCGVLSELEAALPDAQSACPSCGRGVCPSCRCMWHTGLRCSQYQAAAAANVAADRRCRVFWRKASAATGMGERRAQQQHLLGGLNQQQQQHPVSPMSP